MRILPIPGGTFALEDGDLLAQGQDFESRVAATTQEGAGSPKMERMNSVTNPLL
jgi:hypothetical protein